MIDFDERFKKTLEINEEELKEMEPWLLQMEAEGHKDFKERASKCKTIPDLWKEVYRLPLEKKQ